MKKLLFIGFGLSLLLSSCEDYIGDTNEKQANSSDFDLIAPNQMLAGAITDYAEYQVITLADYGNKMAYVSALNTGFTTNDAAYSYNYTSSNYTGCFQNAFLYADNFQDIIDKKSKYPNYEYHFGISKIFKVMCMDYLTALYGDVPYSKAFDANNLYPAYDDDKTIIPKLFAEIDEARAYLNTTNPDVVALASEDVVFGGDIAKWIQFANTIELKLLMRLSKTTDPALVALRTSRAASIDANQDFITDDVTCNPGYYLDGTYEQRNPIFRVHGLNEARNAWTSTNRAYATGDYFIKVLSGTMNNTTLTTGIVDPRRGRLSTTNVGAVQGLFPTSAVGRYTTFYFGRIGFAGDDIDKNASERDVYLMLAAESHFLKAEAIQRNYISGTAQQAFNDGITASFDFYNRGWGTMAPLYPAPISSSASYISAIDGKNGLGWTGSADKINCIITQKYIALAQWHGIELYIDHLRTGYPVLPLPVGASFTNRPNRLIYPTSEYSSNSSNVPSVVNTDLFTVNSKTPYYLQ